MTSTTSTHSVGQSTTEEMADNLPIGTVVGCNTTIEHQFTKQDDGGWLDANGDHASRGLVGDGAFHTITSLPPELVTSERQMDVLSTGSQITGSLSGGGEPGVHTKQADGLWTHTRFPIGRRASDFHLDEGWYSVTRVGPDVATVATSQVGDVVYGSELLDPLPVGTVIGSGPNALQLRKTEGGQWAEVLVDGEPSDVRTFNSRGLGARRTIVSLPGESESESESETSEPDESPEVTEVKRQLAAVQATLDRERTRHEEYVQRVEQKREEFNDAANSYANENDLCERYDRFMENQGFRSRTSEYEVRTTITATFTSTVEARNESAAREQAYEDHPFIDGYVLDGDWDLTITNVETENV